MNVPIVATAPARPKKRRAIGAIVTVLLLVAIAFVLGRRGLDFYLTDLYARVEHPDYRVLSPTGSIGQGYGVAGTVLIFTNLLYLVRRRFAWLRVGRMERWLDMHVVTGLVGSVLIVFHSAFQARSPIAVAAAGSLGIVVVTGLIGRYIYAITPRAGQVALEQRLTEISTLFPALVEQLRTRLAACPSTRLRGVAPSLLRVLITVPRWLLEARRRRRIVREVAAADGQLLRVEAREPDFARGLVRELAVLAAREVDSLAGGALLRTWRSMHALMAIMMLLSVAIHVGVAWYYGYRWLLSE